MHLDLPYQRRSPGPARVPQGWFPLTAANVAFDHATHTAAEHAFLLDFTNYDIGPEARVGVEIDLDSARALLERLEAAIAAAEASGLTG